MKVFFDMEFTGLHQNTTPISLGACSENGRSFYAEFDDFDESQVDEWIQENVVDKLVLPTLNPLDVGLTPNTTFVIGDKETIRDALSEWLAQFNAVQMYSDCLAYDWVLFCQSWGHAFDIPENVSPAPHDINQDIARFLGISDKSAMFDVSREEFAGLEANGKKHNALWDAQVIRACYTKMVLNQPQPD